MKHFGDITKISGYTAPVVDCIIGGSPCQDLSIAGKRAGLDGERSGLFMEQLRIIKEMREKDVRDNCKSGVAVRPRYMVWENVPGAFSSNKGEDFRVVLEETAKVADKDAVIPRPDDGKWVSSGCIMGHGWSIAWRVLDAQFWGVPQRRRRIALVADFGGHSAPEVLFVRKSVSRDTDEGIEARKGAAFDAERGFGADDCVGAVSDICTFEPGISQREGGGKGALIQSDKSATLSTLQDQTLFQPVYSVENHPNDSRVGINEDGIVQALTSRMGTGGGNVPLVLALDRASFNQGKNAQFDFEVSDEGVSSPLVAKGPSAVCYSVDQGGGKSACNVKEGQAPTLTCTHGGEPAVIYAVGINGDKAGTLDSSYYKGCGMRQGVERDVIAAVDCRNCTENYNVNGTLQAHPGGGASLNLNNVVRINYIVRRLTPLECERLQGFPDGWTDIGEYIDSKGKKRQASDAARYKALGNSIALPPWRWVLKRLSAQYERNATMASLFDGIGGFPKIWEEINGTGSCLWASEIEEFPIAVTKRRFNDECNMD